VLGEIPLETFAHVFDHWMERLEWVSQANGGHYPYAQDLLIQFFLFRIRDRGAKPEWNTFSLDFVDSRLRQSSAPGFSLHLI
jgi:hypothetical protein